jgi:hypothetical protein
LHATGEREKGLEKALEDSRERMSKLNICRNNANPGSCSIGAMEPSCGPEEVHTAVPTLMRGNTPPTTRSPPHQSRLTGNPPNLQPVTVSEEERGGRDPTSRRTPMRAAPDCRPPPTARHALQPRSSSTSHPPQQQDAVHRELRPGTGKGARADAGPLRRTARPAAGPVPAAARPAAAAPRDTVPANNTRPEERRT